MGIIVAFEEVSWYRAVHGAAVSGTSAGLIACNLKYKGRKHDCLRHFPDEDLFVRLFVSRTMYVRQCMRHF